MKFITPFATLLVGFVVVPTMNNIVVVKGSDEGEAGFPSYSNHGYSNAYPTRTYGVGGGRYGSSSSYGGYGNGYGKGNYGYSQPHQTTYHHPPQPSYGSSPQMKKQCCEFDGVEGTATCSYTGIDSNSGEVGIRLICDVDITDDGGDEDCFPFDTAEFEAASYASNNFIHTWNFGGPHGSIQAVGVGSGNGQAPNDINLGIIGGTDKKKGACGEITIDTDFSRGSQPTIDLEIEGKLCINPHH